MECPHVSQIDTNIKAGTQVCEDCMKLGDTWVQLRVCKTCGYVGCCDSSKNRHARAHHHETGHPIIGPAASGQEWLWCYIDDAYVEVEETGK